VKEAACVRRTATCVIALVTGFDDFQASNSKFADFYPIPNLFDEIRRTSSQI